MKIAWFFTALTALAVPVNLYFYFTQGDPVSLAAAVAAAAIALVCTHINRKTMALRRENEARAQRLINARKLWSDLR